MRIQRAAWLCAALSLIGLGISAYLGVLHIALLRGELIGGSVCGASGTVFNCHAVTGSSYGSLFGFPLAFLGVLGYLATLTLALIAWQFPESSAKALLALTTLGLLFVAIDAGLFMTMVTQIRYLCLLCLLTYAVNLLLLLVGQWGAGQPWRFVVTRAVSSLGAWLPQLRVAVVWIFWGVMLTGSLGTASVLAAVSYMQQGAPGTLRKQVERFVQEQRRVTVDVAHDPIVGEPSRPIQVVEFSDFLCPSCQRAAKLNPIILAGHRHEVAFVFKHFPLDSSCNTSINRMVHQHACQLAAATECAHEQGRFLALHDAIFVQGSTYKVESLQQDAARLGLDMGAFKACLDSGRGLDAVKRDIAEAARLGVSSTPSYFINGIPITGTLTPAMFDEFLRALRKSDS